VYKKDEKDVHTYCKMLYVENMYKAHPLYIDDLKRMRMPYEIFELDYRI
jgi:hypothetical protein